MSVPDTDESPKPAGTAGTGDPLTGVRGDGAAASGARLRARELVRRALAAPLAWPAGIVVAAVVLFAIYLRLSRTTQVTADGASNALQAWDMLHGNFLLRGWTVSDVSFYTTELPQYMAVELIRGLGADVVHVAAAMTYTLLVLLAVLLAKGKATGREALVRVLITGCLMLAPQVVRGTTILLLSPDHVGTQVPLLLVWLLIDRGGRRWYVPVGIGLILAVVLVADRIALTVAVAPLVAVCGVRIYRAVVHRSGRWSSWWFELSLAAAAILAAGAASVAAKLIVAHGGYMTQPLKTTFAGTGVMPAHIWLTVEGILGLYGADFFNQTLGFSAALTVLHLIGVFLAACGVWVAVRRFFHQDFVVQVLAVAIVVNIAGYMFSVLPGTYWGTRQIAAVLPLGAVLAGRLLAGRLIQARLVPAMALAVLCYIVSLGFGLTQPSAPAYGQNLAGWLSAHHLTYGLADYPEANTITLDSGNRVQVREPTWPAGLASPGDYESRASWFDPRLHYANFVVVVVEPGGVKSRVYGMARRTFGPQATTYRFDNFIIMVWHKNLLEDFRSATARAQPGGARAPA